MSLLKTLLLEQNGDLTELPEDDMKEIQANIRKGAEDKEQQWSNALELVHKAYEVSGIQRPTPDMRGAWKQYETNIAYSISQLSKYQGLDGSWRMSSSMFHEALERKYNFLVRIQGDKFGETKNVTAKSIDDVIEELKNRNESVYEMTVNKSSDFNANIVFSKWGIRKNLKVFIELASR